MKSSKFNVGMYLFAAVGGLVSGLYFSKAMYHKGKLDAYNETHESLCKLAEDIQGVLNRKEVNEEA